MLDRFEAFCYELVRIGPNWSEDVETARFICFLTFLLQILNYESSLDIP